MKSVVINPKGTIEVVRENQFDRAQMMLQMFFL